MEACGNTLSSSALKTFGADYPVNREQTLSCMHNLQAYSDCDAKLLPFCLELLSQLCASIHCAEICMCNRTVLICIGLAVSNLLDVV